jgi:GTP-binding protein
LKIISAEFVTSAALRLAGEGLAPGKPDDGLVGVPRDGLPHIAMAGRSNVGKSTLINALSGKKIARTSAAPGKTRLANIYRLTLDGGPGRWSFYLVDLPGYGYARGGAAAASELRAVAEAYFAAPAAPARTGRQGTQALAAPQEGRVAALLLVDSRHPALASDLQAARWLGSMNVEYRVVATKIDKLSRSERARNLKALETSSSMPPVPVSAASGEGLDALWKTIVSLVRTGRE